MTSILCSIVFVFCINLSLMLSYRINHYYIFLNYYYTQSSAGCFMLTSIGLRTVRTHHHVLPLANNVEYIVRGEARACSSSLCFAKFSFPKEILDS